MEDAWQSQDIAPSGISIPTDGAPPTSALPSADGGDAPWNDADRERDRDAGRDRENGRGGGGGRRGRSRSRSPAREGERGHNPGNNLHVSGLSLKVDTRDLEAAFAKIGRVKKASVMHDPHTRESRGFGFVTMESAEEADAAVAALHGTEMGGKAINVEKARRGRARTPTPGRYHGPPKRGDGERPYDPRPYDSRYSRDYDERGGRGGGGRGGGGGGGRYDDSRGGGRDDHRGGGGRDYDRGGRDDYRGGGGRDYDRGERGGGERGERGGRGGRGGYEERRY
ncbi:hypothetical protein DFH07DRAFT_905719 [Mycena maculata]|uniref:RRM domain-containing protein n=1 Tax=Mycena maculata TaxID=230809 RepID=A0AAD7I871_9AGAR|nr:hypothetical protein DFH07DRAFT_905719 [Mycena maculata]